MSYALLDNQTGGYMATGYGDKTLDELKQSMLSYASVDFSDNDPDWLSIQKLSVDEIAEMWDFNIEKGEFLAEHAF